MSYCHAYLLTTLQQCCFHPIINYINTWNHISPPSLQRFGFVTLLCHVVMSTLNNLIIFHVTGQLIKWIRDTPGRLMVCFSRYVASHAACTYIHTHRLHSTTHTQRHNTTAYTERKISHNYHSPTHTYSVLPILTISTYVTNIIGHWRVQNRVRRDLKPATVLMHTASPTSYVSFTWHAKAGGTQISNNRHMKH